MDISKNSQRPISVFKNCNIETNMLLAAVPPEILVPTNPCVPSPCGPNAECRNTNGIPSCSCLSQFIGQPPNCRPECSINSECPSNKACIKQTCRDPCPGSCGLNAACYVSNHIPICTCNENYIGDPFNECYLKPPERKYQSNWLNQFPLGGLLT